ncbi:MAG: 4Fe-4S binding protein [Anaerolineales bacterium]|jgi:ferredoxin
MSRLLRFFSIKASTIAFWREGRRVPGYSIFDWLHGYVYGRWPYLYIGMGIGEHPLAKRTARLVQSVRSLFGASQEISTKKAPTVVATQPAREDKGFAEGYHGKVVPLPAARQLIQVNEPIRLPDLEQVIPYQRARDLILKNPDHIVVLDCPCRSARQNPCLPLDVCLIVGEPFASFVVDHHSERARWISRQEALEILQAEDDRGHVHHAFFKDAMLGRFYAICNCCSCCCGAMQSQRNGTPMLASSGYIAQVDEDLCIGCETCLPYCQFSALSISEYTMMVDEAQCMGCGVCVEKCEQEALSLRLEPAKGIPLELNTLIEEMAAA